MIASLRFAMRTHNYCILFYNSVWNTTFQVYPMFTQMALSPGAIRVLHWKFISDLISARVSVRGLRTDTQSQPYKLHHIIIKYMIKLYICRICSMFYFITRRMRITVMRKYVNETLFRSKEAFLVIHVFASESKWWICFAWQFSKLQIIYL
jgi:hypothetical protein